MPRNQTPCLYKFRPNNNRLTEIITQSNLFFNLPVNFNDPFDSNYELISEGSKEDIITSYNLAVSQNSELQTNKELIDKILNDCLDDDNVRKRINSDFKDQIHKYLQQMAVCSFAGGSESPLLWGHYADCHKGVCLVFDPNIICEAFGAIHKVSYVKKMPTYNFFGDPAIAAMQLFCTKAYDWKYENEYRIIKYEQGNYNFPKESLLQVIFGVKCSTEEKQRIINLIYDCGYQDVEFIEGFIVKNEFRLWGKKLNYKN